MLLSHPHRVTMGTEHAELLHWMHRSALSKQRSTGASDANSWEYFWRGLIRGGHGAKVLRARRVSCVCTAHWRPPKSKPRIGFLQPRLPWGYWCTATILSCCLYRRCCSRVRNGKLHVWPLALGEHVVWKALGHGLKPRSLTGRVYD